MGHSIIQDFPDGSFIRIGKHHKCALDEYVLSVVESDNKNTRVWLNEAQLIILKNNIEQLIQHKLSTKAPKISDYQ